MTDQAYMQKKASDALHNTRENIAKFQAEMNKYVTLDFSEIPDEKMLQILPLIDQLESWNANLNLMTIIVTMIGAVAKKENE